MTKALPYKAPVILLAAIGVALGVLASSAHALPGALDPGFGISGVAVTAVSADGGIDQAHAVATQPDGKLVVAGRAVTGGAGDFAIVRYLPDGSPDASFGAGGKVLTNVRVTLPDKSGGPPTVIDGDDVARASVIQPDGKIIVGGYSYTGVGRDRVISVARYNTDGSPDTTFGAEGIVTLDVVAGAVVGGDDAIDAIAVQPDGKIVGAGHLTTRPSYSDPDWLLVRWNADGSLDTTFGDDPDGDGSTAGVATTSFVDPPPPVGGPDPLVSGATDGNAEAARAVAIDAMGRIVVGGFVEAADFDYDVAVARFSSGGQLDGTFGDGGRVTTRIGPSGATDVANAVAVDPTGAIVVAGYSAQGADDTNRDFALARYLGDGSPDSAFGIDGVVTTAVGTGDGEDEINGAAIQVDGKVVVAGQTTPGPDQPGMRSFAVARYDAVTGALDSGFGSGGIARTPDGSSSGVARAVAIQPDGRIVAAGQVDSVGATGVDTAVARFLGDESDLAITESGPAPSPVVLGGDLVYEFTVTNSGPDAAYGVALTDDPPAGSILVSADPSQGTCGGGVVIRCELGPIPVGAEARVTITLRAGAIGLLTNRARVAGATFDAVPAGNEIAVDREVIAPPPEPPTTDPPLADVPIADPPIAPPPPIAPARVNAEPDSDIAVVPRRARSAGARKFAGTASDDGGAARVQIAVYQLALTRRSTRAARLVCRWMNGSTAAFRELAPVRRRCRVPIWLSARGGARWTFKLKRPLPPGVYVAYSRAIDSAGLAESSFGGGDRNRVQFTVR